MLILAIRIEPPDARPGLELIAGIPPRGAGRPVLLLAAVAGRADVDEQRAPGPEGNALGFMVTVRRQIDNDRLGLALRLELSGLPGIAIDGGICRVIQEVALEGDPGATWRVERSDYIGNSVARRVAQRDHPTALPIGEDVSVGSDYQVPHRTDIVRDDDRAEAIRHVQPAIVGPTDRPFGVTRRRESWAAQEGTEDCERSDRGQQHARAHEGRDRRSHGSQIWPPLRVLGYTERHRERRTLLPWEKSVIL